MSASADDYALVDTSNLDEVEQWLAREPTPPERDPNLFPVGMFTRIERL